MTEKIQENNVATDAWQSFVAALGQAAETITGPTGATNPRERAEGFRYLTRLLSGALDMHLEKADASRPAFTRMLSPTRKFLGDNPDVFYDYTPLDARYTYRLFGTRGAPIYLAFCIYGKKPDGSAEVGANLFDEEIHFEKDGSFEIFLSAEKPSNAKNWIELGEHTTSMIARQYFFDLAKKGEATYEIEAIDGPKEPPTFSEEEFARRISAVGHYVNDTAALSAALSVFSNLNPVARKTEAGADEAYSALQVVAGEIHSDEKPTAQELAATIDPNIVAGHMPTPDIQYAGAWWEIQEDEAVVAEGKAPDARYWALQIFNRWLESPDYRFSTVALNSSQVQLERDGTFRIVLASRNPGVANWIDTAGHQQGQICFRALVSNEPLEVKFHIAKLEECV